MEDEVGEEGGDGPRKGHDGAEEVQDRFPVSFEVVFRELNADCEALNSSYETGELHYMFIADAPLGIGISIKQILYWRCLSR